MLFRFLLVHWALAIVVSSQALLLTQETSTVVDSRPSVSFMSELVDTSNSAPAGGQETEPTEAEISAKLGFDDYHVPDTVSDDVPLIRVIGSAPSGVYADRNEFFALNGQLRTSMRINGRSEASVKNISYMVGARSADGNIPRHVPGNLVLAESFRVSDNLQADITYASTRNTALPRTFNTMSLAGVAERLAKGVAKYSIYGTLTTAQLRGGGNVNVRAISAATDNVAVGPANVFVTKRAAERLYPAVDCALFNAISGEGGTAYTDLLAIDGNGVPQVPVFQDAVLASGCYQALMQIGRMYTMCNEGPTFALAVFRGVCSVLTVAGHSDEGGHVRAVMRRGDYNPPYGAVLLSRDVTEYTGLPVPGGGVESFRRLTFSVLLGGAAGSANSDPMTAFGSKYLPTILSLTAGVNDDPGIAPAAEVTDAERDAMQAKFADTCGDWCTNYAYYLGVLLSAKGSTHQAQIHLQSMANDAVAIDDDHLRRRVAMPFVWVEPTSITPFRSPHLRAMAEDCGALAIHGEERRVPVFRDAVIESHAGDSHTSMVLNLLFMRRHGAIVHLSGNRRNGMANMHLYSGTPGKFANVGGAGDMAPRILAGDTLDTFQWGRLHNQVVSIGEFVEVNERLRVVIDHHCVPDPAAPFNLEPTHAPTPDDMVGKFTSYRASPPRGPDDPGPLVNDNRAWQRSRTAAAKAISLAKQRAVRPDAAWGANIRPVIGDPIRSGPGVAVEDPLAELIDGVNTAPFVADEVNHPEGASEPSHVVDAVAYQNGVRVPLVVLNVADRGLRAPRAGIAGGGGGGGPGGGRGRGVGGRGGGGGGGGRGAGAPGGGGGPGAPAV